MKRITSMFVLASAMLAAAPAQAASDYLLKLEGVEGEAAVDGWSFGACNAGQCTTISSPRDAASGQATGKTGKGRPMTATYDLATSKGARTASGVNVAVGDVDGDGAADLAFVATQNEVTSFTLTFQKIPFEYRTKCANGKHFTTVTLRSSSGDAYVITDASLTCSGPRQSNGRRDACAEHSCDLAGPVTMTFTGGQLKHTKTGHVTLLK